MTEEQEQRRAEYFARLDAERQEERRRARLNADVRARVRHGHGRRSGCVSAIDLDADGVPDVLQIREGARDAVAARRPDAAPGRDERVHDPQLVPAGAAEPGDG